MDSTALIAKAAVNATLKRTRFERVDAKVLSNAPSQGGMLNVETSVILGKARSATDWVSSVTVKVTGYPKDVGPDKIAETSPVFCVDVMVKGVYFWKQQPPPVVTESPELAYALGRPIYALAIHECRAIAAKMGFHRLPIAEELPRADEGECVPVSEADARALELEPVKLLEQKKPSTTRKKTAVKKRP